MESTEKDKKLIYSNIAKPGSKVIFRQKIGKLNKESIGFAAGQHVPFNFFNLLQFNTPSVLKPDIEIAPGKRINNPCIHSYYIITRIGKTGKFRFELLNIKVPIFNGLPFEIISNGLDEDLSKTQLKLLNSDSPLLANYHNDKMDPINKPPFFNAVEDLNGTDFVCWMVSKYVALKLCGLSATGGKILNKGVNVPEVNTNLSWRTLTNIGTQLLRASEENPKHIESLAAHFENKEARISAVEKLQFEFSRSTRILNIHLQNLLAWSFLLHRNLMNKMVSKSTKDLSSREKKIVENYKKDKGVNELDKFLSKALASVHPKSKETKNSEKQNIRTKINNRFL